MNSITINIDSDGFSCQLMKISSNEEVLTCFYQSSNEIKASSFRININLNNNIHNIEEISSLTNTKEIRGLKIITSISRWNKIFCLLY